MAGGAGTEHAETRLEAAAPASAPSAWTVACRCEDLTRSPRGVIVDGRPIVVWRTGQGRLVALDDQCPHQGNQLSCGAVVGESLRCLNHGWEVGTDGWCDRAGAGTAVHDIMESDGMVLVRLRGVRL